MPTTRLQATRQNGGPEPQEVKKSAAPRKGAKGSNVQKQKQKQGHKQDPEVGEKREAQDVNDVKQEEQPPVKKTKVESAEETNSSESKGVGHFTPLTGTIERGHIYFFYRPKVQVEKVESLDDVRNFHIVLVPRPPEFSAHANGDSKMDQEENEDSEMKLLSGGADAVPAEEPKDQIKKKFRVILVGKKQLPDPESGGSGRGRKETFWATVTTVGDDLQKLESGMGRKEYETKTRGTRHEGPARLVGRGAYAIVNNDPSTPSKRETHLGYHLSHPSPSELGEVQAEMRIYPASSFILQVRNPLAPVQGPQRVGLPQGRRAEYPEEIMKEAFGQGTRGREEYGLRFSSVTRPELSDYAGAELLLIAAREGEEGLETSLGEGRGGALQDTGEKEKNESIQEVLKELALHEEKIPAEPLNGEWL